MVIKRAFEIYFILIKTTYFESTFKGGVQVFWTPAHLLHWPNCALSLLNYENKFLKTEFMFVLCLYNCFTILHPLSALFWDFAKAFWNLNFFLNFSKRVLCISFQSEEHWIVHCYLVFVKHVAIKNYSTYNFFSFCRTSQVVEMGKVFVKDDSCVT